MADAGVANLQELQDFRAAKQTCDNWEFFSMDLRIKKILAREILVFFSVAVIVALMIVYYQNSVIPVIANELELKREVLFEKLAIENSSSKIADFKIRISKIDSQIEAIESKNIAKQIESDNLMIGLIMGLFVLVYPVRLIYFLLRWAIRTLKS